MVFQCRKYLGFYLGKHWLNLLFCLSSAFCSSCLSSFSLCFIYLLNFTQLWDFYNWLDLYRIRRTLIKTATITKKLSVIHDGLEISFFILFHVKNLFWACFFFLLLFFNWKQKKKACFEIYFHKTYHMHQSIIFWRHSITA